MKQLEVSHQLHYDDFVTETHTAMPAYEQRAAEVLRGLTRDTLREFATYHPDGFLKYHIGPPAELGGAEGQVRLHLWLPDDGVSTGQPHSHPFHLVSEVLAGDYNEHQVAMAADDQTGIWDKYQVDYVPGALTRTAVHRADDTPYSARFSERLLTPTGEVHAMPAGPCHASVRDGKGGVTLAVMSPRRVDEAHFYNPSGQAPEAVPPMKPSDEMIDRIMPIVGMALSNLR